MINVTARPATEKADFRPALLSRPFRRTRPEGKMSEYSEKLRDPRWQRKRLEIMRRDDFECRLCADKESTLHVHHLRYERSADPWDYPDTSLVTLCEECHEELHVMQFGERMLEALVAGGINLGELHGVLATLDGAFTDGPYQAPIQREYWQHFEGALFWFLNAVRFGVTEKQIKDALGGIRK